jgi:hypothetical protein
MDRKPIRLSLRDWLELSRPVRVINPLERDAPRPFREFLKSRPIIIRRSRED